MDKIKTEIIEAILDNVADDELRQDAYKELNQIKDKIILLNGNITALLKIDRENRAENKKLNQLLNQLIKT